MMRFRSLAFTMFMVFSVVATVTGQHAIDGDRLIMHTGEWVPRYANLGGSVLRVEAGQVVTLPATGTYDAIEVAGELRNDPTKDTVLRVTNLQVLSGGHLNLTVPCGRTLEIIVRDVAPDTTSDPFRWGTSILAFGKVSIQGCALGRTFTEAAGDLRAGFTSVTFPGGVPAGWSVGNEVLIPDTRQQPWYYGDFDRPKNEPLREGKLTIASISGNAITLSAPLAYDHLTVRDPDGVELLKPRVADLSRNIVIRSENPSGTAGHVATVGHDSTWNIRYVEFRSLGRTLASSPVDNTTADGSGVVTHIGTNQIGRYAWHAHHAQGFGSAFVGNSLVGVYGGGKWAAAFHRVSDSLIEQNIAVNFDGSGFVFEDGDEVRNVVRKNLAAYMLAGTWFGTAQGKHGFAWHDLRNGCAGCEGSGFWFRDGGLNVIEDNESYDNRFGFVFFKEAVLGLYPSVPGGPIDTPQSDGVTPLFSHASFKRNMVISNLTAGIDLWETRGSVFTDPRLVATHDVFEDSLVANNYRDGFTLGSVPVTVGGAVIKNTKVIGGIPECVGLNFGPAYTFVLETHNVDVRGCGIGLSGGGARDWLYLHGGIWQNVSADIYAPDVRKPWRSVTFASMTHKPMPNTPDAHPFVWGGPDLPINLWTSTTPTRWTPTMPTTTNDCQMPPDPDAKGTVFYQTVYDYNHTGLNYCLPGTTDGGTTTSPPPPPPAACADGSDNDGDGLIDSADPGCSAPTDEDEFNEPMSSPPSLTLTILFRRMRGVNYADLSWSGFTNSVDIKKNGVLLTTIDGRSSYTDRFGTGNPPRPPYTVCDHDSTNCVTK